MVLGWSGKNNLKGNKRRVLGNACLFNRNYRLLVTKSNKITGREDR